MSGNGLLTTPLSGGRTRAKTRKNACSLRMAVFTIFLDNLAIFRAMAIAILTVRDKIITTMKANPTGMAGYRVPGV